MPVELLILLATWVVGYSLIASLLLAEYRALSDDSRFRTYAWFIEALQDLKDDALYQIEVADTIESLDQVREKYLKINGLIRMHKKKLSDIPAEDRPVAGGKIYQTLEILRASMELKRQAVKLALRNAQTNRPGTSSEADFAPLKKDGRQKDGIRPLGEKTEGLNRKVIFDKVPKDNIPAE
jgi:hypothetical protein